MNKELHQRLDVLYRKHHKWLIAVAFNVSMNQEVAEELVAELYLYLGEKNNEKTYYRDSFNLMYCLQFIKSRFYNKVKRDSKSVSLPQNREEIDIPYNVEFDERLEQSYNNVHQTLKDLQKTKMWASAKIAEMYFYNTHTLEELAEQIDVSRSTVFLNVKKIREYLKENLDNPFEKPKE